MVENYIMRDNLNYLFEWSRLNPSISENIAIDSSSATITCKINDNLETIYIGDLYLPTLLYNREFRTSITNPKIINGKTLFKLIKIFRDTENQNKDIKINPEGIKEVTSKVIDNTNYLFITLNNNKVFRYKTIDINKSLDIYNKLKVEFGEVTLSLFGKALKDGR